MAIAIRLPFLPAWGILLLWGGGQVKVYLDLAILLNSLVDFLLLLGTNRLMGYPGELRRLIPASLLGGVYAGGTLLPGFFFLGNLFWRSLFLILMSLCAFGWSRSAFSRGILFLLLCMAMGGIAASMGRHSFWGLVMAGGALAVMCRFGFRRAPGGNRLLPAVLIYGDREVSALAFHDTGNTLRDPVTGEQVMVAGADVAEELLALTPWQLQHPIEAIGKLQGMRLIPYHSVGSRGGMLLAIRIPQVQIGAYRGSAIVAFAPEKLSGDYQILTGGAMG